MITLSQRICTCIVFLYKNIMHITIELNSLDYRNKPSQDTFCIVDKHIFTNKNTGGTQHC